MKSKRQVIPIRLSVLLFLALVILGLQDHLKRIDQRKEQSQFTNRSHDPSFNAAICYLQAIDQLKYPSDEDLGQRIIDIVKHGWDPQNDEADIVLQDNARCLDSVHKASNLTRCDFSYNKPYKYLFFKDDLPCTDVYKLGKLLVLTARHHEHHKKTKDLLESCLNTLTFAYHLSLDRSAMGVVFSREIERDIYRIIHEQVESGLSSADLSTLYAYLSHHQQRRIPGQAIVYYQRDCFLSIMQVLADGISEQSPETEVYKGFNDAFAGELMRQAKQSANEYFGYFATAATTNKDADLKKAQNALEDLRKTGEPNIAREIAEICGLLSYALAKDWEGFNRLNVKRIMAPFFTRPAPCYSSFGGLHKVDGQLEELLALVQRNLKKARVLG